MNTEIYRDETYAFCLEVTEKSEDGQKVTAARIYRKDLRTRNLLVLMQYTWPKQLIPEISLKQPGRINERGEMQFTLALAVHHVTGMVQGEFTEEQDYTVLEPDSKEKIVCAVEDIRRKTRFALAERHLEHLPHRTYPPTDGAQGPYGHPSIRSLPPVPEKKKQQ
jgi:hypothetical protein